MKIKIFGTNLEKNNPYPGGRYEYDRGPDPAVEKP